MSDGGGGEIEGRTLRGLSPVRLRALTQRTQKCLRRHRRPGKRSRKHREVEDSWAQCNHPGKTEKTVHCWVRGAEADVPEETEQGRC